MLKNLSDRNGGSLRIHDSGLVDVKGGIGQFAQFVPEFHSDNTVSLRCVRHADKVNADGGRGWHFGVGMNGQPDGRCGTGPSGVYPCAVESYFNFIPSLCRFVRTVCRFARTVYRFSLL